MKSKVFLETDISGEHETELIAILEGIKFVTYGDIKKLLLKFEEEFTNE